MQSRVVLGIDAAWTARNPSGVALAIEEDGNWTLVHVAASYRTFEMLSGLERCAAATSLHQPSAVGLLNTTQLLCGRRPDLIAVDMPMSLEPITGRRASDSAVSRAYGGRKCSTHSPSAERPGKISDQLRLDMEQHGYALNTTTISESALIEVYPHPALVELAKSPERLPYKVHKIRNYWPSLPPAERRNQLMLQWRSIITLLGDQLNGVKAALPLPSISAPVSELKSYEDMIDAVVCAWAGICALSGKAKPYGDQDSAIWIPSL